MSISSKIIDTFHIPFRWHPESSSIHDFEAWNLWCKIYLCSVVWESVDCLLSCSTCWLYKRVISKILNLHTPHCSWTEWSHGCVTTTWLNTLFIGSKSEPICYLVCINIYFLYYLQKILSFFKAITWIQHSILLSRKFTCPWLPDKQKIRRGLGISSGNGIPYVEIMFIVLLFRSSSELFNQFIIAG